jgi:hypothetical protein
VWAVSPLAKHIGGSTCRHQVSIGVGDTRTAQVSGGETGSRFWVTPASWSFDIGDLMQRWTRPATLSHDVRRSTRLLRRGSTPQAIPTGLSGCQSTTEFSICVDRITPSDI